MTAANNRAFPEKSIRLAVVGAGLVGRRHIESIAQAEGVVLSAIVDQDTDAKSLAVAAKAEFYSALSGLLETGGVDGIIIATPNSIHVNQGLECIAAGYPVLVEKPIAVTTVEASRLVEASREANVPLLIGHQRRFNRLITLARKLLTEGRLGDLRSVHASCWLYKPDDYFNQAPWRARPGAGPVFVNLIHDVDLLRYLCGEVISVQAQVVPSARGFNNEDVAGVLLRFDSDVIATLSVSDTIAAPWSWEMTAADNPVYPFTGQSCYWLGGTQGALSIPDMTLWQQPEPDRWQPFSKEAINIESQDPLICQIEHFAAVIRGEAQPLVSGEDGAASLRVIEAIHQSAANGSTVYLG